jgi:hypothetical protein
MWLLDQCAKRIEAWGEEGWKTSLFNSDGSIAGNPTLAAKVTALLAFCEFAGPDGEFLLGPAPWPEWKLNQRYGMRWGILVCDMRDTFRAEHGRHLEAWLKDVEQELQEAGIATCLEEASLPAVEKGESNAPPIEEYVFVPSGKGYLIKGFGESGHLSGYIGLDVIARLIQTPGQPVSMLELVGAGDDVKADKRSPQSALDLEAMKATKEKLAELRADLDRAQRENNTVEVDMIRKDIEALECQIQRDTGLGGEGRDLNNLFDKLRPRIINRLKAVYRALKEANPPMAHLADHFELSISSEKGCFIYRPGPLIPSWKIADK